MRSPDFQPESPSDAYHGYGEVRPVEEVVSAKRAGEMCAGEDCTDTHDLVQLSTTGPYGGRMWCPDHRTHGVD